MTAPAAFWSEVAARFDETVALPEARRRALLARVDDTGVRREVESLLDAHDRACAAESAAPATAIAVEAVRVGPFRIVERIGRGGMGAVYRAVRDTDEFSHVVALKVVHLRPADDDTLRRFQSERQILATLRHPGIVSLIDGGVTHSGQAWLAMELVEGAAITAYCRARQLGVDARLRLFQQVCSAVHYAHRHLVLHRDLKPANILVTPEGGVKVLDFGIARLLGPDSTDADGDRGQPAAFTPGYASPEQIRGDATSTASDTYSLGILLFELVTDRLPYDASGRSVEELLSLIRDRERFRTGGAARIAGATGHDLETDIEAIVLKATAPEPDDRYAGVDALADDITRYLGGHPVTARPATWRYHTAKALARHRITAVVGSVATLLVLATTIGALVQWRAAALERDRAERRFEETLAMARTVIEQVHDEVMPLPGSVRIRQRVVTGAQAFLERLSRESPPTPALQLELARSYRQLGTVLGLPGAPNAGDTSAAIAHLQRAADLVVPIAEASAAEEPVLREAVQVHMRLCEAIGYGLGRPGEAKASCERALAYASRYTRRVGDQTEAALLEVSVYGALARVYEHDDPETYLLAGRGRAAALHEREPTRRDIAHVLALAERALARHYEARLQPERAAPYWRRTMELSRSELARAGGDEQADSLRARASLWGGLTVAYYYLGRFDEAAASGGEAERLLRRLLADDPEDRFTRGQLGYELVLKSRVAEAQRRQQDALAAAAEALQWLEDISPGERLREVSMAEALLRRGRLAPPSSAPACRDLSRAAAIFTALASGPMTPREREWAGETVRRAAQCRPSATSLTRRRPGDHLPGDGNDLIGQTRLGEKRVAPRVAGRP